MRTREPVVKKVTLMRDKLYRAILIWRMPAYSQVALMEYYISPQQTHCYFYEDAALTKLRGCFPLHWFEDFQEVTNIIEETRSEKSVLQPATNLKSQTLEEESVGDFQQLSLFRGNSISLLTCKFDEEVEIDTYNKGYWCSDFDENYYLSPPIEPHRFTQYYKVKPLKNIPLLKPKIKLNKGCFRKVWCL